MTPAEFLALPDRGKDAVVAERVMGLARNEKGHWDDLPGSGIPCYYSDTALCDLNSWLPAYSSEIAAAWEVVEKIKETHSLTIHALNQIDRGWLIHLDRNIKVHAEHAPLAICLAALKAVGFLT